MKKEELAKILFALRIVFGERSAKKLFSKLINNIKTIL